MFKKSQELAIRLNRHLVAFDIEHTGGTTANRGITEFAAYIISPTGEVSTYSQLVKPHRDSLFVPLVTRLTGITEQTVKGAPSWVEVVNEIVLKHQDSLWIGFNSRASDIPIMINECTRYGITFLAPDLHLDLMRVSDIGGSLAKQSKHFSPKLDVRGAHRARKDAYMTLHLLEKMLEIHSYEDLAMGLNKLPTKLPATKLTAKTGGNKPVKLADEESSAKLLRLQRAASGGFLVNTLGVRKGFPWYSDEIDWVVDSYQAGKSIDVISNAVGRSLLSIAFAIKNNGTLSQADKDSFNMN